MSKALKCDRCGGFFDLNVTPIKYVVMENTISQKRLDMCPACYKKLLVFLKKEEDEEV